jgi:HEAT repeats
MISNRLRLAACLAFTVIAGCGIGPGVLPPPPDSPEVVALVTALRSNDAAVRAAAATNAAQTGLPGLAALRTKALIPALPEQVKSVGLAYDSFARAAVAPGNDALRVQVASGFLDALEAKDPAIPAALRDELLAQLALLCEDAASTTRVAALLSNPNTHDGARRALEAIATPDADRALIAALQTVSTAQRPEIARALGRKRVLSSVPALVSLAGSNDPNAAAAARYALARIGDAQSRELLLQSLDPAKPATGDDLLVFAARRAEQQDFATAEALYADLLTAPAPHHRAAAALGLAEVERKLNVPVKENVDLLVRALADEDAAVRAAAEAALSSLDSMASVALLRQVMWDGEATLRPALLRILVKVDPNRADALAAGLHDPVPEVRAEALRLAAPTASAEQVQEFLQIARDTTGAERSAAVDAALVAAEAQLDAGLNPSALLASISAIELESHAAKHLARLATRDGDLGALTWLESEPFATVAGDDGVKTRIALAAKLVKQDASLGQHALEKAYLDAKSTSARNSALGHLKALGVDPVDLLAKVGFLVDWHILGPLPRATPEDFETTPYSNGVDLASDAEGVRERVTWRALDRSKFDGIVDLKKLLDPNDDCSAYGYAEFESDGGPAQVMAGSDDGCAVWLNGTFLYAKNIDRGVNIDEDRVNVELKPGKNALLIKVNQGNGGFGFCVRVAPGHAE